MDRFADLMVKDEKTGECHRLDHLIKAHLEKVKADKKTTAEVRLECDDIAIKLDGMTKEEMRLVLRKFDMKAPVNGNDLSDPIEFNLMFSTYIGPTGLVKGFLRPETAQGIFVNFKRLLEFNQVQWMELRGATPIVTTVFLSLLSVDSRSCRSPPLRSATRSATRSRRARV